MSVTVVVAYQTINSASSNSSGWPDPDRTVRCLPIRWSTACCETRVSAKTNTRSKKSSRKVARCGSSLSRSSKTALLVTIRSPALQAVPVSEWNYPPVHNEPMSGGWLGYHLLHSSPATEPDGDRPGLKDVS